MKFILPIMLLLGFYGTAMAGNVIDSEAVDFETESEYCKTLIVAQCFNRAEISKPPLTYVYNPIQKGGTFEIVPQWYLVGSKMRFIPVLQYR